MKKEGFTLIELIIVIVIIGILAAIAVPKFVGLTGEAKTSAIKGLAGSIRASANIVRAKWLTECNVKGNCSDNVSLEDGTTVCVDNSSGDVSGYPYPGANASTVCGSGAGGIETAVNTDGNNDIIVDNNSTTCTIFYYKGIPEDTGACSGSCSSTTNSCEVAYIYDGTKAPNIVICTKGCK